MWKDRARTCTWGSSETERRIKVDAGQTAVIRLVNRYRGGGQSKSDMAVGTFVLVGVVAS